MEVFIYSGKQNLLFYYIYQVINFALKAKALCQTHGFFFYVKTSQPSHIKLHAVSRCFYSFFVDHIKFQVTDVFKENKVIMAFNEGKPTQ